MTIKRFIICFVFLSSVALANNDFKITIQSVNVNNKSNPKSSSRLLGKAGTQTQWVVFTINYRVKFNRKKRQTELPNAIEKMEVRWELVSSQRDRRKYYRMKRSVDYSRITEGEHVVTLFVHPKDIEYYFETPAKFQSALLAKVSFVADGRTVEIKGKKYVGIKKSSASNLSSRDLELIQSENSEDISSVLYSKNQTPWRYNEMDFFDIIDERK